MKTTRRTFTRTIVIGSVTLVLDPGIGFAQDDCTLPSPGTATRFIPKEPKVLPRLSAAELAAPGHAAQLKAFRAAIGKLRALPPADVVGWTKLIAQHCIQCAPADKNNIHFDWQFAGWHRALLYFVERTLRSTIGGGDDNVRLPYWDWENAASRTLPAIYRPKSQPLHWNNRGDLKTHWPLTDEDVDVQGLLAIPDFRRFGGTGTQGKPTPAMFSGPHANVHNNFDPGDMTDLQYSPRDPVFYAHHANIDRLWSSWVANGHANPDFGAAKVSFYDETRTWRYIFLNDLRDETKLGYRYSSLMKPVAPANTLTTVSLNAPNNTFLIAPPSMNKLKAQTGQPFFVMITNIQNLEKLPEGTRRIGIFSKPVASGARADAANGYLGKASRVFSNSHAHAGPLSASLNITGKTAAMTAASDGTLKLYLAPLTADGVTSAAGVLLTADEISLVS